MKIEEQVKNLIEPKLKEMGVKVDNIEYLKEGTNNFLRITIDKDDIVDIDTCVEVTRIINPMLDKADLIKESYILDISSKERGGNNA